MISPLPASMSCPACGPTSRTCQCWPIPGEEAGIGVLVPVKEPPGPRELDINARTRNLLLASQRCRGERGFALMSQRWRALQRVMVSPSRIGDIARAALVLVQFEHKMIT